MGEISLGSFAAVFGATWSPKLGLDLAGGLAVVYQTEHPVASSQLNEAVTILNNRVNGLGVSGAQVSTTGANERGQATWYAAAPPGRCASPTLPFGTVLTVTNVVTGASTTCTVDDREQAGYPRVVDMSPSGFAQLARPSQGVVDVTISW